MSDKDATSEDPMDHEYDAQADDDGTNKIDQGLESPPNGPSAAHFREAARLAAARARKTLEQTDDTKPRTSEQTLVSDDFKKAATKHARSASSRSKNALNNKRKMEKAAEAATVHASKTEGSIALLDERLHLGARMLRAFESQIQRLEEAGAEVTSDTPTPETSTQVDENITRLEECLIRAEHVEKRMETLLSRAEDIASGLGNGIEICNAIQSSTQERARESAELENAQQQRGDAIIQRTQAALTRMEETLASAQTAEVILSERINEPSKTKTPTETLKQDPPVIEIHARTPRAQATPKAPAVTEQTIEQPAEQFSLGTLSVEPGRARNGTRTP